MLRFAVFEKGKPAKTVDLSGAYLVGGDGVPIRAEIEFKNGEIQCKKRAGGPAALALMWPLNGGGRMMLETSRLTERNKPYILQLELLRGRLMRISQKREDWGLYDFEGTDEIAHDIDASRDKLIEGLQADKPEDAASISEAGLVLSLNASERLTAFHAEIFLNRRKQIGGFPRRLLGAGIDISCTNDSYRKRLLDAFDYVHVPINWREVEPREKEFNWKPLDQWIEWTSKHRVPVRGGPLVSFAPDAIPDWLHIWEHDFDAVRDLVYEHIRRIIGRYGQYIHVWDVISGMHANNCFSFSFEQLMELTRMATAVTKQMAPRALSVIDIITPWGEYYATNQRTIPPMLYAEMAIQSGINFDVFGVHCNFGVDASGYHVRDLFQISSMLDRFACFGKPVHLTGIGVPSGAGKDPHDAWKGEKSPAAGGAWHKQWNEETQKAWLRRVYHIALSKPFVEALTWCDFADTDKHVLPHGGLLRSDFRTKPAYQEILNIRKELSGADEKTEPISQA